MQSGAYQVGAVNYSVWDSMLAAGRIDSERVQVIWTTPSYADYQWTIRGDVNERYGEGFLSRVQEALLSITDPELLASFPRSGFIKAENADYRALEDVAQAIGLLD